jgi:cysteine-rich repeat protein
MKTFGSWVALGVLCIGTVGAVASCGRGWGILENPTFEDAQENNTGGSSGVGGRGGTGGTGGTGTAASTTGAAGGEAKCGDSMLEMPEGCDDGNESDGDGCSSTCQVEECWKCSNGTCMPLAPNEACNNGAQVCDGKGGCGECVPKEMACDSCKNCGGYECDNVNDCASAACVTGVCRSANGSACSDSVECISDYCFGGKCAECTDGKQCISEICNTNTNRCFAALGEPCDGVVICGVGQCTPMNICQNGNGSSCANHYQCVSNRCEMIVNGLGTCAPCAGNPDCGGVKCDSGVCQRLLPGNFYCVDPNDCASGKCIGFPRRCAP